MAYQTSSKRSSPFCLLIGQKNTKVSSHQSEVRTAATVWNWSGKTLSPGALLAVHYFSSCHIFPPVQTFPRPHHLPLGLRGCKGSIHYITCSSWTCAPLFVVHCPFPVSRASVHSQQRLFPPIPLCSDWNLCLARSAHYIFSSTRTYINQVIILFLYICMYL